MMRIWQRLLDFYLDSSIHVGIEVCCFVMITFLSFNIPFHLNFLGFVFFGTITGYNFIKYAGVARLHHRSLTRNLKTIQIFSFFCFLGFVYFAWHTDSGVLWLSLFFGLFTIFYAIPFLSGKSLRNIKGIKVFVIAFVVTGLTMFIPVTQFSLDPKFAPMGELEVILSLVQRFVFIIALLIPFEIRDLEVDHAELGTIPQKIGVRKAKVLGMALLAVFLFLEAFKPLLSVAKGISTIIIGGISAGFIVYSNQKQSKYYASFWVEAIPIFWFMILWILCSINLPE